MLVRTWRNWITHTLPIGKPFGGFFYELNMKLPSDPVIEFLGTYPETWNRVHIKTCTQIFKADIPNNQKTGKKPRYLSMMNG